jgi:hypothetical protein
MWSFVVVLLALAMIVTAGQHGLEGRVHKGIARRAPSPSNETSVLQKRYEYNNARWTFFDDGLGACGDWNVASDFIVALNTPQYGYGSPGPQCFKMITMSYNGKTTTAQIMDECPSCSYGELDLSRGLFDYFADESLGEIYGSWSWGSGGGDSNPAPAPQPQTTTTPKAEPAYTPPAPKTTYTPPAPTTTTTQERAQIQPSSVYKVQPSSMTKSKASSTKSASSSKSSSSSINYNAGYASGLVIPTGSVAKNSTTATGSLIALNTLLIQYGSLIVAGGAEQ